MKQEGLRLDMENISNTPLEKIIRENQKKPYRKNNSKLSDISKSFNAETIYIGSKSRNTNAHIRIYDKKKEQES